LPIESEVVALLAGNTGGQRRKVSHSFPKQLRLFATAVRTRSAPPLLGFRRFPSAAFGLLKEGLPEALSGGEMLRVPIARALVIETLR
jgi:ABC-type glutathione transport system ATPase component